MDSKSFGTDYKSCNTSIECSVASCAFHNQPHNCCSLESIKVGCSNSKPTKCEGTECASFKLGGLK